MLSNLDLYCISLTLCFCLQGQRVAAAESDREAKAEVERRRREAAVEREIEEKAEVDRRRREEEVKRAQLEEERQLKLEKERRIKEEEARERRRQEELSAASAELERKAIGRSCKIIILTLLNFYQCTLSKNTFFFCQLHAWKRRTPQWIWTRMRRMTMKRLRHHQRGA